MNSRFLAFIGAAILLTAACNDTPAASSTEVLTGTVVAVDARSLTDIVSFTLRRGGEQLEIYIDDGHDYSATGFLPQHLREHVITGVRVRVEAERRGNRLVAIGMTDAD